MPQPAHIRLGVNVDHVATLRNARGGLHPDPVKAAHAAIAAGADGIMIEVHPCPERALSDGPQSLDLKGFALLMEEMDRPERTRVRATVKV